jgi:hypothetical protein
MGEPQLGTTGALVGVQILVKMGYPLLRAADETNPP